MPTVNIGPGAAPNCTVGASGTWSSADNVIGNGAYTNAANLVYIFNDIIFDTGSANGRINSFALRVTFSLGTISAPLSIVGGIESNALAFDDHPNPCQADTPISGEQWSGFTSFFTDVNIATIPLYEFIFSLQTTAFPAAGGLIDIADIVASIDYEQYGLISITPTRGDEGTDFVIKGTGFTSPSVEFDGVPATDLVYVDSTTITGKVPAHAAGFVDVVLDNGSTGGIKTLFNGFRYGSRIDSVSLSHGAPFGDSLVNITGIGFSSATITNIFFDDEPATNIFVLNDENVSCHTPAHALGSVFITIEFDSGPDIVSDIELFTYIVESFKLEIEIDGEDEPIEWVEPIEVGDEVTITSEDEDDPLDLTTILTLELVPVDGGTPISITITLQEFYFLIFDIPAADPGIYAIVGTTFSGSVILGILQVLLVGNASGVYTLVANKTNDTIYNNARDGTTQDVRIPNPKIKTGFIGQ